MKLLITINSQHIKGSPYSVHVGPQYSKPDKIVSDGGRMDQPWGIACGNDGVWAVVDQLNHCVYIFDGQDQLVRRFGSKGNANSQFIYLRDVAFDANNHLYVVCGL